MAVCRGVTILGRTQVRALACALFCSPLDISLLLGLLAEQRLPASALSEGRGSLSLHVVHYSRCCCYHLRVIFLSAFVRCRQKENQYTAHALFALLLVRITAEHHQHIAVLHEVTLLEPHLRNLACKRRLDRVLVATKWTENSIIHCHTTTTQLSSASTTTQQPAPPSSWPPQSTASRRRALPSQAPQSP